MDYTGGSAEADHLCVLVHGLWGNPNHMANIAKSLRSQYPADKLYLLLAKRNSGSFTYDGIERGGERVCAEIEEEIGSIEKRGGSITKISIVGYSLGGLVARYAISIVGYSLGGLVARYAVGLLYAKGLLDKLECMNFTTFASPHLGVRTPLKGWHNHVWNVLGARTLSMSGRQLFTIDKFRDTGRPLLQHGQRQKRRLLHHLHLQNRPVP
ncbi:Lipid droplet phospholipase 1 like protein [Verticillium longisporum]|nr:Lipid droplet phospholipase 1 like protein [Verticillium longisporum]